MPSMSADSVPAGARPGGASGAGAGATGGGAEPAAELVGVGVPAGVLIGVPGAKAGWGPVVG
eukprot:12835243-Alexandrium_andersonii.AAC.1